MHYLLYPLGSLLPRFGLAAVVSPVLVADNTKSDCFDLGPDLDMTCEHLIFFKYWSRAFDCPLSRLASAIRSRVWQGKAESAPLPRGARSAECSSGALRLH